MCHVITSVPDLEPQAAAAVPRVVVVRALALALALLGASSRDRGRRRQPCGRRARDPPHARHLEAAACAVVVVRGVAAAAAAAAARAARRVRDEEGVARDILPDDVPDDRFPREAV